MNATNAIPIFVNALPEFPAVMTVVTGFFDPSVPVPVPEPELEVPVFVAEAVGLKVTQGAGGSALGFKLTAAQDAISVL
jgi:hypothetical protein